MNIIDDYLLSVLRTPRTRTELCRLSGMSDRKVRKTIEKLRKEGHCIIHDGNTYTLTEDVDRIEEFLNTIDSYIKSYHFNYRAMRDKVAQAKGQKCVTVRQHVRRLDTGTDDSQVRLEI
jgi:transcription initiation factor IIE alpha subunit